MAYTPGNQQYVQGPTGWVPQISDSTGAVVPREGSATMFYDDFSGSVFNITDFWAVVSGATPTVSGGMMVMPATASTTNAIRSQDVMPLGTGYADFRAGVMLEATAAVGAGRFWGLATSPSPAPSPTSLIAEGAGFEVDQATGSLYAVTYTGGVRTLQNGGVALSRPTDGALHRYAVQHRVTGTFWFIDSVAVSVATASFPNIAIADLYTVFVRQNAATYTGTPVFNVTAVFVGDTARDATMLADATVGARRAKINTSGELFTRSQINSTNGLINARPDGFLQVRQDPTTLLFDTFETVDTTNTWTIGGTVTPTGSNGTVNLSPGTTASATTRAQSQPSFTPGSSAFLQYASIVQIEAAVLTGSTRWWGLGVPNSAPTTTTPITNGSIFEVRAADGLMYGSVYSGGALTQSVALSRPADGTVHRYQLLYKASRVYFNIDNVEVGSLPFPNPVIAALPASMGAVNGGTAVGTAPVLTLSLVGVADTAPNQMKIADGTYPWRKAKISAAGAIDVNLTSSAGNIASVTGTLTVASATSTTQTTSSTSGTVVDVSSAGNATITVATTGTTAAALLFEASLDSTGSAASWFPIDFTRTDGSAVETRATVTGTSINAWNVMAPGYKFIRVRLASVTTVGTIAVQINQGPFLYDPSPTTVFNPLAPLQGPSSNAGSVPTPVYLSIATVTNTTLIAAPAAGLSIYVTDMEGSNPSAALTTTTMFEGTTTVKYVRSMAASGGGFVTNLRTPWKLPAATAMSLTQSAANQGHYTVNYYIAP